MAVGRKTGNRKQEPKREKKAFGEKELKRGQKAGWEKKPKREQKVDWEKKPKREQKADWEKKPKREQKAIWEKKPKREQEAIWEKKPGQEKARVKEQEPEGARQKKSCECPVYKKCGGCQYLHMDYKKQLDLKRREVSELLKPYGKLEDIIGMEKPKYYRHKVHAVFGMDSRGRYVSGVYQEGTHQIVPVDTCLLEHQKADAIIRTVRTLLKSFKIRVYDEDKIGRAHV